MSSLMRFFDCFFIRRRLTRSQAEILDHQQAATTHQDPPDVDYRSGTPPTPGIQAQTTSPPSPRSPSDVGVDTPHTGFYGGRTSDSKFEACPVTRRQGSSPHESIAGSNISRHLPASGSPSTSSLSDRPAIDDDVDEDADKDADGYGTTNNQSAPHAYPDPSSHSPNIHIPEVIRKLDRNDWDVIGALFSHPRFHPGPKEVDWDQFQRTMTRLGFSKVPGNTNARFSVTVSNDMFPAESMGQVVTAHRPHGGRIALDRSEVREVGSRLTRLFGWTAEMFVRYYDCIYS
ncbi:hypothetical protein F4825DRAFT_450597 [Nemania diffusa]|nr:hypothetical protein F4825DRAFT_450597 [Nemania diffusa]